MLQRASAATNCPFIALTILCCAGSVQRQRVQGRAKAIDTRAQNRVGLPSAAMRGEARGEVSFSKVFLSKSKGKKDYRGLVQYGPWA